MEVGLSIVEMLKEYFTNPEWIVIFFISFLFCFKKSDKLNQKKIIIIVGMLIVLIFNDCVKGLFDKVFHEGVFYRFLWMIPMTIIIAYAMVLIYRSCNNKMEKIILFMVATALILTIEFQWRGGYPFLKHSNVYLLTDDTLGISQIIHDDTDEEKISVVLPAKQYLEIRTYDASIVTTVSRSAYISYNKKGKSEKYEVEDSLIEFVDKGIVDDIVLLRKALFTRGAKYLVLQKGMYSNEVIPQLGCEYVDSTINMDVYRINYTDLEELYTKDENSVGVKLRGLVDEGYLKNINELSIDIDGNDEPHTYCIMNDIHMWASDDDNEVRPEYAELVKTRIQETFASESGLEAKEIYYSVLQKINESDIDGLILNADIVDQRTTDNTIYLQDTLSNMNIPYMYLRSDHDIATTWTNIDKKKVDTIEDTTDWNKDISIWEEKNYIILGINKSWKNMTADTLEQIKTVFKKEKPIIIITHVPYDSIVDKSFAKEIEAFRGKKLLWGDECYYVPNETMREYLDLIYDENTPVVAVIAAHLHKSYTVQLTDNVCEYVLPPGFEGNVTILTVN